MRTQGLEMGFNTEKELDDMVAAWGDWIEADDAMLGIMNGQVIVSKS